MKGRRRAPRTLPLHKKGQAQQNQNFQGPKNEKLEDLSFVQLGERLKKGGDLKMVNLLFAIILERFLDNDPDYQLFMFRVLITASLEPSEIKMDFFLIKEISTDAGITVPARFLKKTILEEAVMLATVKPYFPRHIVEAARKAEPSEEDIRKEVSVVLQKLEWNEIPAKATIQKIFNDAFASQLSRYLSSCQQQVA